MSITEETGLGLSPVLVALGHVLVARRIPSPSYVRTAADVWAVISGLEIAPDAAGTRAVHLAGDGRVLGVSAGPARFEARELMHAAVALGSAAIIVTETGTAIAPARAQLAACGEIMTAARALGIRLLDYILFGQDEFCSFRARGLL